MKKSIYSLYKTDKALQSDGVWFDHGEYGRIKLARAGESNQAFSAFVAEAYKKFDGIPLSAIPEDEARGIMRRAYAHHVVRDYEFVDEKGETIQPTPENTERLFEDLPDLFRFCQIKAGSLASFRIHGVETAVKN